MTGDIYRKRTVFTSLLMGLLLIVVSDALVAQPQESAHVTVTEPVGLSRADEVITFPLQLEQEQSALVAIDRSNGDTIYCQVLQNHLPETTLDSVLQVEVAFPVRIAANETRQFDLILTRNKKEPPTDLTVQGSGTELVIENNYFRADLTRSAENAVKDHASGQLRELHLKNHDTVLKRGENRIHWAPTFGKRGVEYYKTIATWDNPEQTSVQAGPYLVRTIRSDTGPDHPEIQVTAQYQFYGNLPYFTFYSEMVFQEGAWIHLLRNDEMTMDSLFTHVAFRRKNGEVVDLPFSERYDLLQDHPIANDDPWLCFYHSELGYAFGGIRLQYDNTNTYGSASPMENPHTHVSDGAGGGKYWNRRLIYDDWLHVPEGSRYREKNAYIVFSTDERERFQTIEYYAERLRNPLDVRIIYNEKN